MDTEALAAHADELADFDAQLYPKPWDSRGPMAYVGDQLLAHAATPGRIHMSAMFRRELLTAGLGARRYFDVGDVVLCTAYGVPISVDSAMSGFTMRIESARAR